MNVDFVDLVKTKLDAAVTSTATLLPCWGGDLMQFRPRGVDTYAVIRDVTQREVVKVVGIQPFTGLIVQRGQDGSTPKAFASGSIISSRITKGALATRLQKGVMRQVAYNPNAVLLPAYFGEKVAETGVDGCTHRIWQNVADGSAQWRIVYGDMCKDFTNYRDWNWPVINYPWPWWNWTPPVIENPGGEGNIFVGGMIVSGGISCSGSLAADYLVCNKEGQPNNISAGGDIKTVSCICAAMNVSAGGKIESESSITIDGFLSSGGDITAKGTIGADTGINCGRDLTTFADSIWSDDGAIHANGNITSATAIRAKVSVTAGGTITAPDGVFITG